jgi:hypothetical protein
MIEKIAIILAFVQSPIVIAVITWAANMQSRVNVLESQRIDFLTLIDTKFEVVNVKLDAIGQRTQRLESALNNNQNHVSER